MLAICKSALSEGSGQVTLLYANRDEKSVIFGSTLRDLAAKYPPDRLTVVHWLESVQGGLPSTEALGKLMAPYTDRQAFICGPGPFMQAAEQALESLNVPAKQVHIEVFRSLDTDPFAAVKITDEGDEPPASAVVELDGQTHTVSWPRSAKLLDVLLDKGGSTCRSPAARGALRSVRGGQAQRRRRDGHQRRPGAQRHRRGLDPGVPGAADLRFGRSHLRRVGRR